MAKRLLMEEYHVTVLAPHGLPVADYDAIRRTLTDPTFEARLRKAVRRVFRKEASLDKTKVRLGR